MTNLAPEVAVSVPLPRITFVHGNDGSKLFLYACEWRKGGKQKCGKPSDWHVKAGLVDAPVCHDHLVGACRHALEPSVRLVGRKPGVTYAEVAIPAVDSLLVGHAPGTVLL